MINCNKKFCYNNENCFLNLVAKHQIGTGQIEDIPLKKIVVIYVKLLVVHRIEAKKLLKISFKLSCEKKIMFALQYFVKIFCQALINCHFDQKKDISESPKMELFKPL